jgi:TRAP-type mannitol/chloroaromatic compound transport system substrate-binding protein
MSVRSPEGAAPALVQVGESVVSPLADPLRILSERLALATDGQLNLHAVPSSGGASGLLLAREDEFADTEPLSRLLGGYPFAGSAHVLDYGTWLRGMGGQALWNMSAAHSGWKPLLVGVLGGADAYVWSRSALQTVRDLEGKNIVAPRAVHDVLRALGASPQSIGAADLLSALEAGRIDVFETDDPSLSLAVAGRLGRSVHAYTGSMAGAGCVLALRVPLAQWEQLSSAEQAIMEAVAQETAATLQAVRHAHRSILLQRIAEASQRRPRPVSMLIRSALSDRGSGLLARHIREDGVFVSALASMKALVASPRGLGEILELNYST